MIGSNINREQFIDLSNKVHNYTFGYDKVVYIKRSIKVTINCEKHGDFEQTPKKHLLGQKCPRCGGTKKYTNEEFIDAANKLHKNKYDYEKTKYVNGKIKIIIICKDHGEFLQRPDGHLLGYGCMKCSGKERLTNEKFIERSNIIHNNKYNYDLVEYKNSGSKLLIKCEKHGIFIQGASTHLSGCGCPKCNESKGERNISILLEKLNITYVREHKFAGCRYKNELRFDFYLPLYNMCIEYNGRQHYESVEDFGGLSEFTKIKKRDRAKKRYCSINKIDLILIKYNEDNEDILVRVNNLKLNKTDNI